VVIQSILVSLENTGKAQWHPNSSCATGSTGVSYLYNISSFRDWAQNYGSIFNLVRRSISDCNWCGVTSRDQFKKSGACWSVRGAEGRCK
jgi:hypothetical protein